MNARREAKYRHAENEIVNAKITRLAKKVTAGVMTFTLGCVAVAHFGVLPQHFYDMQHNEKPYKTIQSYIDTGFNNLYKILNMPVKFTEERDKAVLVKPEIPLN